MAQHQGPSRRSRAARATRRAGSDHAFNARLLPQLFLTGNAANLNHGINPITAARRHDAVPRPGAEPVVAQVGFSQKIPLTGGTLSVGSQLSRIDQFGDRRTEVLADVAGHRQSAAGSVQAAHARVGRAGAVAERVRRRAGVPRGAGGRRRQHGRRVLRSLRRADVAGQRVANVAVNDTLYTLNKGRFEVGKIGENDLLKSELALLRARAAVDDAQARARSRRGGAAPHDRLSRRDSRSRS